MRALSAVKQVLGLVVLGLGGGGVGIRVRNLGALAILGHVEGEPLIQECGSDAHGDDVATGRLVSEGTGACGAFDCNGGQAGVTYPYSGGRVLVISIQAVRI